ncbi:MAG: exosortase-dependent surface protein XDP1 [Nitrincola lacisaponensis]|uniref:exosortase-dependent surface protein XDP1 n=1 Tax=Nitrincola lacisaponensis TaxID=267850 RepID=UPI00391D592A
MKNILKGLAAAALVFAVATPVSAASFDLSFNTQNTGARNSLTYSYNDGLDSLTVYGLSGRNNQTISGNTVQTWAGYGMGTPTRNGSHRVSNDSINGQRVYQMVLFDFGREVSLDSFTVGDSVWGNNNWASVLAYTDTAPLTTLNGLTWSSLLDNGFSHAGDANTYTGVAEGTPKLVEGGLTSQYWLVGVYNAVFSDNPLGTYNEGFKLTGISFSTMDVSEVPLPAAAWLFLTGLAGMSWMKKRKQKRDQLQAA